MSDFYTEDLAEFGSRERKMAAELLSQPLPDNFSTDGVRVAFNKNSGFVFLVNDDYQCAIGTHADGANLFDVLHTQLNDAQRRLFFFRHELPPST